MGTSNVPATTPVYLVDDDYALRRSLSEVLNASGFVVQAYSSARAFLADGAIKAGCLVADVRMPEMDGMQLFEEVRRRGIEVATIVIASENAVSVAVKAIKAGAVDFIEKPVDPETLVKSVSEAISTFHRRHDALVESGQARALIELLTAREHDVFEKLIAGQTNKEMAMELGISPRTIEIHRSNILQKLRVRSVAGLVRIGLAADRT